MVFTAVLPADPFNLTNGVRFEQQPSLTWKIDKTSQRIVGTTDDLESVSQAVEIILNVERFRWQIYKPSSGMQWNGLVGQNPGYVSAELQRRIREALTMDNRVRGISNFSYTIDGNNLIASLTVNTVYGDTQTRVEVNLN